MDNITINNGIRVYNNDKYHIYQMYTLDGSRYYISIPNSNNNELNIAIDFKEEYYDSLLDKEIIEQIKKRCDLLYKANKDIVYLLPDVSTYELDEAKKDNDKHAYEFILNKLKKYTNELYYTLSNSSFKINQIITIITETDDDKKFMHFLELENEGFFRELEINKLLDNNISSNDTGSNPSKSGGDTSNEISNSKPKAKILVKNNNKHGFSNMSFIIITLLLSLIIGISLATLLYFQ